MMGPLGGAGEIAVSGLYKVQGLGFRVTETVPKLIDGGSSLTLDMKAATIPNTTRCD